MYKVFVDDTPIILSTEKNIGDQYLSIPIKEANIKDIIKKIKKEELFYVNLFHPKEHKLIKHLETQLKPIIAGGGLVYNKHNEILFIYRKNRWDLPKGGVEKKESFEEAAIREVEEETGATGLKIIKAIQTTYHVMKHKGKYRLKVTHWFEMRTNFTGELKPQNSEDISKAEWKNFEQTQKALKNSFENIKLLFPKEYLTQHPKDRQNL